MGFFKNLFAPAPGNDLKQKIAIINDNFELIVQDHTTERFNIMWYGAYDIDPKDLVFWICVQTDDERDLLIVDDVLMRKLRGLFERYEYPEAARNKVHIGFESQQTVDRVSGGNWFQHFK